MRLVLLGGGPGHLNFIRDKAKNLGMNIEVILVHPESQVFYKPAFNSVITEHMSVHEAVIDLRKISTLSGVTFIQSQIEFVDLEKKSIKFVDRATIQFDYLSIEGVEEPQMIGAHGKTWVSDVKELDYVFHTNNFPKFFQRLKELETILKEHRHYPYHMVVVGAGRTGIQLALALSDRFKKFSNKVTWEILEKKERILTEYHPLIGKRVEKELREKDILFHTQFQAQSIKDHVLKDPKDPKKAFDADLVFVCAGNQVPNWIFASQLPVTPAGYIDTHANYTLKNIPFAVAAGQITGQRPTHQSIQEHVEVIEKLARGQEIATKKQREKVATTQTTFQLEHKTLKTKFGFISEKEKPYIEFEQQLKVNLEHLRGLKEQRLAQLTPQIEDNTFVDKFKKRLLMDLSQDHLDAIFSEKLNTKFEIDNWCEREYKDVFSDHYLSSYYLGLDLLDQSYSQGGRPKYLRLYVSAPGTIKDVEILSQILIGAFRACNGQVELRVHLCGQAMNTVQFSLGVSVGMNHAVMPEPMAYIALTRPLGLYGLLSQQGKEGWEGQWLSNIWDGLIQTQSALPELVQRRGNHFSLFQLSENGFINDVVKHVGSEGWKVSLNLSKLPRWEGVDQVLKRKPNDGLLQNNWKKGFRYWSGQGEQIPESQYLLWEPHLTRPPTCLLIEPAYSKELSMEFKNKFNQQLYFIGYVEKAGLKDQTQYQLSDWDFENRVEVLKFPSFDQSDQDAAQAAEKFEPLPSDARTEGPS